MKLNREYTTLACEAWKFSEGGMMRVNVGEVLEKMRVVSSQDHVPVLFDIGTE